MIEPLTTHTISKSNRDYYYFTKGNTKGQALMIIPGFSGTHEDLINFASKLSDEHYIIIPDFPGWGKSAPLANKHSIEHYVSFLEKIIDELKVSTLSVVGHCMGTALGIELAGRNPKKIRQIFLISPPYENGSRIYNFLKHLGELSLHYPRIIRPVFFLWRNRIIDFFFGFFVLKFHSRRKKLKKIINGLFTKRGNETVVEENLLSMYEFSWEQIKLLRQPIHIIHGGKDILIGEKRIEALRKMVPKATLNIIKEAGHLPPVETPQSLATIIKKYLK